MKTKSNVVNVVSSAVLISLLLGCSADTKHGMLTGTVTLDGEPLKTGTIRFEPADGRTATAESIIQDGKFTANVPPGDKRVSISASKVIGKKKMYDTADSPVIDMTEEMIPKRYNAQSELKLTVKVGKQDAEPTFELKSK